MSRKGAPPESLWGDAAPEEPLRPSGPEPANAADEGEPEADAAPAGTTDHPPDWALPSWDYVPVDAEGPESARPRANSPSEPVPAVLPATPTAVQGAMPASAASPGAAASGGFALRILGVSEITRAVRDSVRAQQSLRDVWVEGEVGRVTVSSAGHAYFTLKDERSQLACVFFRDDRVNSPFEPRTGLRVVAHGRVDVFESQGVYQLYVSSIQPAGFGDLALQFEALKAKLAAEGLFETGRKRPLPERPAVVGVATSASGAVWHDICHVVTRRWPLTRLVLAACQVQGEGAAASVAAALDRLARWGEQCRAEGHPEDAPAVVILARGGGSLEDLWPFNDERVVRAVVAHPVPVVCGVGHEVDVTLADFAADVRAPTPSAAAELVVPDRAEVAGVVAAWMRRAAACTRQSVASFRGGVAAEGRALERLRPSAQLAQSRERAGYLLDRATATIRTELTRRATLEQRMAARMSPALAGHLSGRRVGLERAAAGLTALGPQATLDRGYAIVRRAADGAVVREPDEAPAGVELRVRVARGELDATSRGAAAGADRTPGAADG
jgi:exodeoxyribonuclease VII large subunit